MKFKAQINPLFKWMSGLLLLFLIPYYFISNSLSFLLTSLIVALIIIVMLREFYIIEHEILSITKGLKTVDIAIRNIEMINIAHFNKIEGIEIYSKDKKIVVFPEDIPLFIEILAHVNPNIHFQNMNQSLQMVTVR